MYKTDSVIRQEGMKILLDKMGMVDAERFISLIIREPFDYTKWREDLFDNMSLQELAQKANEYCESFE
ncbi:MAG: hypothetical protein II707_06860 [Spirochaetales bacterium]|nr:hypothetical protein [Spirochaetales bacterium]MBR6199752.1 hypothetical protein [Spirochaetales bacterium]